jgi:hypothetical protein
VPENPSRRAISADGAMVPFPGGAWADVRTLAIGDVPARPANPGNVHAADLSPFSRLTDAATFPDLAEVDIRRRRLIPRVAQQVVPEQRCGGRAFFAALPWTKCGGLYDPLTSHNRSIEQACEDTSAHRHISLRNPWADPGQRRLCGDGWS